MSKLGHVSKLTYLYLNIKRERKMQKREGGRHTGRHRDGEGEGEGEREKEGGGEREK